MKIRMGFVSNSSSSSFIVATQKGSNPLVELTKALKLPEDHLLAGISATLAKTIDSCLDMDEPISREWYEKDYTWKSEDGTIHYDRPEIGELMDKGYDVYTGSFSNEESDIERFLCENDFNYKSDNLILIHEGGY